MSRGGGKNITGLNPSTRVSGPPPAPEEPDTPDVVYTAGMDIRIINDTIHSTITSDQFTILKEGSLLKGNYTGDGKHIEVDGNVIRMNVPEETQMGEAKQLLDEMGPVYGAKIHGLNGALASLAWAGIEVDQWPSVQIQRNNRTGQKSIQDATADGETDMGDEGTRVYVNPAWLALWGSEGLHTEQDAQGQEILDAPGGPATLYGKEVVGIAVTQEGHARIYFDTPGDLDLVDVTQWDPVAGVNVEMMQLFFAQAVNAELEAYQPKNALLDSVVAMDTEAGLFKFMITGKDAEDKQVVNLLAPSDVGVLMGLDQLDPLLTDLDIRLDTVEATLADSGGGGGESQNLPIEVQDTVDEYPPTALTDDTTGMYKSSCSSVNSITYPAWKAFNKTVALSNDVWISANVMYTLDPAETPALYNYTGSVVTVADEVNYAGEWIQLECPAPTTVSAFSLSAYSTSGGIAAFVMLGSNDASTWKKIYDESGSKLTWANAEKKEFLFPPMPVIAYQYYRLVVLKSRNVAARAGEWAFYRSGQRMVASMDLAVTGLSVSNPPFYTKPEVDGKIGAFTTIAYVDAKVASLTGGSVSSTASQFALTNTNNIFTVATYPRGSYSQSGAGGDFIIQEARTDSALPVIKYQTNVPSVVLGAGNFLYPPAPGMNLRGSTVPNTTLSGSTTVSGKTYGNGVYTASCSSVSANGYTRGPENAFRNNYTSLSGTGYATASIWPPATYAVYGSTTVGGTGAGSYAEYLGHGPTGSKTLPPPQKYYTAGALAGPANPATGSVNGEWLQLDMAEATTLTRLIIYAYVDTGGNPRYDLSPPFLYVLAKLPGQTDADPWYHLGTITSNMTTTAPPSITQTLNGYDRQYIKIRFIAPFASTTYGVWSCQRIELYSDRSGTPTTALPPRMELGDKTQTALTGYSLSLTQNITAANLKALAFRDSIDYGSSYIINKPAFATQQYVDNAVATGQGGSTFTLDYTSATLTNKPTLGSLAALSAVDYTSVYLTNKPILGALSTLASLDYASTYLTNKPTLGALAALSTLDYTSATLINKPTLGTLAGLSSISYASSYLTGKPTLGSLAALSSISWSSSYITNKPNFATVAYVDSAVASVAGGSSSTDRYIFATPLVEQEPSLFIQLVDNDTRHLLNMNVNSIGWNGYVPNIDYPGAAYRIDTREAYSYMAFQWSYKEAGVAGDGQLIASMSKEGTFHQAAPNITMLRNHYILPHLAESVASTITSKFGGKLKLEVYGTLSGLNNSTLPVDGTISVMVDGVQKFLYKQCLADDSIRHIHYSFFCYVDGVAAGSHTLTLRWSGPGGTVPLSWVGMQGPRTGDSAYYENDYITVAMTEF